MVFDSEVNTTGDVISLNGQLSVTQLAGLNLDEFVEQAVMIDEPEVFIDSDVRFQRHLHTDQLTVLNLLNGRHIDDIVQSGISQTFTGPLTLSQLTVYGNVTFQVWL